jgi:hypothetical protein
MWKSNDATQPSDVYCEGIIYKDAIIDVQKCKELYDLGSIHIAYINKAVTVLMADYISIIYDMRGVLPVEHTVITNDDLFVLLKDFSAKY